jgi:endoribonuclease Dicer
MSGDGSGSVSTLQGVVDPFCDYDNEENDPNLEAENTDGEQDAEVSHEAETSQEKRRLRDTIFEAYVSNKTSDITRIDIQVSLEGVGDEKLSVREILAKEEPSRQILTPRDYQTELFQRAREENIIAVLDTGSGKTHIATLLLRHTLDLELEARRNNESPKIAFFLVSRYNNSNTSNVDIRTG